MTRTIIVFGRTPAFSWAELSMLVPGAVRLTEETASIDTDQEDISRLFARLGGAVKIVRETASVKTPDMEALAAAVENHTTFGLSHYGRRPADWETLPRQLKEALEAKGMHVRYVTGRDGALSSVQIDKHKAADICIIGIQDGYLIGRTIQVQEYELWSQRDYGRPHSDAKAGMLPSKVARMAVNIALGPDDAEGKAVADPFCGMGTVLGEALTRKASVVGSDVLPEAVEKARQNIAYAIRQSGTNAPVTLFTADATHFSEHVAPLSIDAIVTEPFMGTTRIGEKEQSERTIINTLKGLEKLYRGCLRDWLQTLKPDGKVMIAVPSIVTSRREYFVKNVIDSCETLGYTKLLGPITYSRPHATVRRNFYLLGKKE